MLNVENRHQFVAVYGQSGTGKSHLIRWLEARYRNDRPSEEVVLFIRRSDNTLKGTIRQLLETPEVREIANRDVIERLVKATVVVDEEKLKGSIYYDFINEIQYDQDEHDITLKAFEKKRLVAFLSNDVIRDHLMAPDGPIERIFSRIAENTNVDRDTIAQFRAEDLFVSQDLYEEMTRSADQKAEKLARKIMANEELSSRYADYLNQFVNEVIRQSAGIQPGDFGDIFKDIRRELLRTGKRLTLFIEDVTSFTGVDEALLDALLIEHTSEADLCRISSFVGTTSAYLEKNFRDNHKDRITDYLYVPDGAFDDNQLVEFVARYLNAMSLPAEVIETWAKADLASTETLPVHTVTDGEYWESVTIEHDKELNLYPFTRHSILYCYKHALNQGKRTPRYIIRGIIEPIVKDILENKSHFPSNITFSVVQDHNLLTLVQQQISDSEARKRYMDFITIWGDGTAYQHTSDEGITYYASIREEILYELDLPIVQLLDEGNRPHSTNPQQVEIKEHIIKQEPDTISEEARAKVDGALRRLEDWVNGAVLDYTATGQIPGVLRNAYADINSFVNSSIDWQAEGISIDNITKINRSSRTLIAFERPAKTVKCFYIIPAQLESIQVIGAFLRWRQYGKESWNYEGSDFDAYIVSKWLYMVKDDIVRAVSDEVDTGVSYIKVAIASEIYRLILTGTYRGESLGSFDIKYFFRAIEYNSEGGGHHRNWNTLVRQLSNEKKDADNAATVRRYFDIRQGTTGGSITVLDTVAFKNTLEQVKKSGLVIPGVNNETKDTIKLRNDILIRYNYIIKYIEEVASSECEQAKIYLLAIDSYLKNLDEYDEDEIDRDDIIYVADEAQRFYNEANNTKLSISYVDVSAIKKSAGSMASAIKRMRKGIAAKTPLDTILAFSTDPIGTIEPLVDFLKKLDNDLGNAEKRLQSREEKLGGITGSGMSHDRFNAELNTIASSLELLDKETQS